MQLSQLNGKLFNAFFFFFLHFHYPLEHSWSTAHSQLQIASHDLSKDHTNFFSTTSLFLSRSPPQTCSFRWPFQSGHLSRSLLVKDPFISQLLVPLCLETFQAVLLADKSALLSDLWFSCIILGFSKKKWFAWIIITSLFTEATQ